MSATEALIFDAVRTPRGKGRSDGALNEIKPVDLAAQVLEAVRDRNGVDTALVDDVLLGCVSPVGEQGGDIAVAAAARAKFDQTVGGAQLNRFCGSGLETVNLAAQKVASGWEDLVVAGGVESMSRVSILADGGAWIGDPDTMLRNNFVPQGIGADMIATIDGYTREDVDAYAVESQKRAANAWAANNFFNSIVPVKDEIGRVVLDRDEYMRPDATVEGLSGLKPAFAGLGDMGFDAVMLDKYSDYETINHVHHAGNSSGIVDGAAAVLVGSEEMAKRIDADPRARVLATAVTSSEPTIMLTGPAPATRKALDKAGLTIKDIDLFEVNEAFASVPMRFMKELGVPHEKVNVNGGAIAMGHPLGATGAMLLGTLLDELERRDLKRGLVTLCIGGGMGIATIVERV
ncbi:MAG: acetyl-CoA C-acetyltransferase [Hyphomicrobiaceae bacterium TMED74]|nr:acetyl-CoA acetyltransferase [Filomicrobium sp.]RPG41292.1 MAG: acetyl-CoA C-acetyltransferase [Hyphomicrobiaceae bacterium TMED74]